MSDNTNVSTTQTRERFAQLAHTQQLYVCLRENGEFVTDYADIFPTIGFGKAFWAEGQLPVMGSLYRPKGYIDPATGNEVEYHDMNSRWAVLDRDDAAEILMVGLADGTATSVRRLSRIAGNSRGAGSEPAILVELTGSPKALELAEKYGVNYSQTVPVGRGENVVEATTSNAFIIDMVAANHLIGSPLALPGIQKETERESRKDNDNPTLVSLIATIDELGHIPARINKRRISANFDPDFAKKFLNGRQRVASAQTPGLRQSVVS